MEPIIGAILALLVICACTLLGNRTNVAAPVLLVLVGIAVGFAPFAGHLEIDPELVLGGVLPPLLYATSVSMPSTNFRRDFGPIATLSVVLVITSAVLLGLLFWWLVPGLSLAWGIALGAIISPSDAVATSILKNVGVSGRIQTILEGEGLLNDAPSLVLLRVAVAATAASVGFWQVVGNFFWAVLAAIVIGVVVGRVTLAVRQRITDRTVSTALSFAVPFAASVPADLVGASGLVAAVTAGLVTGRRSARVLPPFQLMADAQNWRTLEFVLEGSIFLFMGLQFRGLLQALPHGTPAGQAEAGTYGLGTILALALLALVVVLVIRAGFVAPLLAAQHRRARRGELLQPRLQQFSTIEEQDFEKLRQRFDERRGRPEGLGQPAMTVPDGAPEPGAVAAPVQPEPHPEAFQGRRGGYRRPGDRGRRRRMQSIGFERFARIVQRNLADVDYLLRSPMSWRDGAVIVWAGMRGAVTVAAAMTLPLDTPNRPVVLLLAFCVAGISLVVQGATLPAMVRWIRPTGPASAAERRPQVEALFALLRDAERQVTDLDAGSQPKPVRLAVLQQQRQALLAATDVGPFDSDVLEAAMTAVNAEQIGLELRGGPEG